MGRPVWGVEIRVVGRAGDELPRGAAGEIQVRGANVMTEYLDDPTGTVEALRGGWLATGDVGRISETGVLTVVDRLKDVLIRGGNNIYPAEIEDVLASHAGVAAAAVVGREDEHYGQELVAVVVPAREPSPSPEELAAHCKKTLSKIEVPREWTFVPRLPLGDSGKVLKRELQRLIAKGEITTTRVDI